MAMLTDTHTCNTDSGFQQLAHEQLVLGPAATHRWQVELQQRLRWPVGLRQHGHLNIHTTARAAAACCCCCCVLAWPLLLQAAASAVMAPKQIHCLTGYIHVPAGHIAEGMSDKLMGCKPARPSMMHIRAYRATKHRKKPAWLWGSCCVLVQHTPDLHMSISPPL